MAESPQDVLFICYSHTDQSYRERFTKFLRQPSLRDTMQIFSDADILPGEDWQARIAECLQQATAALVLVSQDFMISPFIQQVELRELLIGQIRRGLRLFLVPVRSTLYQGTYLEKFQWARPPDKALSLLSEAEQEQAMTEICLKILKDSVGSADTSRVEQTIESLQSIPKLDLPAMYELQRSLGEGELARCYLARDRLLDRDVIIKVLKAELSRESPAYDRYVRSASRLKHRNILGVLFSQANKLPHFIVTPMGGETLAGRLAGEGGFAHPTFDEAVRYTIQLAETLAYAHGHGCVHGRLRPSEVRFDDENQPVLTGFRTVDESRTVLVRRADERLKLEDFVYASPEHRENGQANPKSDQYLLGLIAYEMIAGAPAARVATWAAALEPRVADALLHPRPLKEFVPSCSERMSDVVMRMLAVDPDERWDDLDAVVKAMTAAMPAMSSVDIAKESYRRCAQATEFYETVYRNLFDAIPDIRGMFTQPSLERQYGVLRDSIWLLLTYPELGESGEPTILSGVARSHPPIGPGQMDAFREAVVDAVSRHDSTNPELLDAWRAAMRPGLEYLQRKLAVATLQTPAVQLSESEPSGV